MGKCHGTGQTRCETPLTPSKGGAHHVYSHWFHSIVTALWRKEEVPRQQLWKNAEIIVLHMKKDPTKRANNQEHLPGGDRRKGITTNGLSDCLE